MDHPDDVHSPFRWLDDADGFWNDFLSLVFAGTAWPEGSENAVWDLAQEWGAFADDLSAAAEGMQSAASDLLAAWDAPAAAGFDDLARTLLGSPDVGLPGHLRNAVGIAQQTSGFGVDLQYAKVSVNVAVAVAAMAVVLSFVLAVAGGLSLVTLGPIASIARQAVIAALEKLATAAGRRALVDEVGQAVADQAAAVVGRAAAHSAGRHLTHEVVEEVLEELVIDATTQAWQMSHGSRTDWNGLSTLQAAIGGGVGGAVGAGAVAPVFTRLRRTPRLTALAGRGADGGRTARLGNFGLRHTGGLVATASTNVVASPAGGIAASLLTRQGFLALDWSDLGAAALGAVGRYGTVSPTNPAVLSAAAHPMQTLAKLHADALAGHTAQQAAEALRLGKPSGGGTPANALRTTGTGAHGSPHPGPAPAAGAGTATPSPHTTHAAEAPTNPTTIAADGPAAAHAPAAEPMPTPHAYTAGSSTAGPNVLLPDVPHGIPTGPVNGSSTVASAAHGVASAPASVALEGAPAPASSARGVGPAPASTPAGSPGPGHGYTAPGHGGRDGAVASRPTSEADPSGSTPTGAAGSSAPPTHADGPIVPASDGGRVDVSSSDGSPDAGPEQVRSEGDGTVGQLAAPAPTDRPATELTAVPAEHGGAPVSRTDVGQVVGHRAPTEVPPTAHAQVVHPAHGADPVGSAGDGPGGRVETGGRRPEGGLPDHHAPITEVPVDGAADRAVPAAPAVGGNPDVLFDSHGHGTTNAQALVDGTDVPMTLESVRLVADRLGLDLTGVDVRVNVDAASIEWYDHAGGIASTGLVEGVPQIIFAPASFLTEEILVRTVAHEMKHVEQYRHDRVDSDLANRSALEAEAYGIEDDALDTYQEVSGGHQDRGGEDLPATGTGNRDLRAHPGGERLHGGRPGGGGHDGRGARPGPRDARPSTGERATGGAGDLTGGRVGSEPRIGAGQPTGVAGDPGREGVGHLSGGDQGSPAPQPPADPPASEQELLDGMPEPLRRYLVEAVAHGQVWADLVQGQLGDVVQRLVERGLPAPEAVGLAHAVKGLGSAARKIQPSIQGGSTFASSIWSMDDLVRFSLQIDPARYGESVLQALEVFRGLGWSVPAVPGPGQTHDDWRNTWAVGNRHHGLLVVLTHTETGQRVEMQFPTPQSWAVGKRTHKLYEVFRMPENGPLRRVAALSDILEVVRAEQVEDHLPDGLDLLGDRKPNGASWIFRKEVSLAAEFLEAATDNYGSPEAFLLGRGVNEVLGRDIVRAARRALRGIDNEGEGNDGPRTPGMADLGTHESGGATGAVADGHGPSAGGPTPGGASPRFAGGPRTGTSRPAGPTGGRAGAKGDGLRVHDRHLEEAGNSAGPRPPERPGSLGDGVVRRAERYMDLGSDERSGSDGPGALRRGPVHPGGAGHAGAGGGTGPVEGHDPADSGTPAGDVPQPRGPGVGHVGDPRGPGEAAQPAALTGPLAVGADAASALQYALDRTDPPIMWEGADGVLPGRVVMLADGSTVRINTGPNPWARTDPDRPLQMWTVGSFHLDDGPLTPAASAFLADLLTALEQPGAGLPGPASHWLAQRATLDPSTHQVTGPGVATPVVEGARTLVWDAAQGWVDARLAGGLARAVDDVLIPAHVFAGGPAAEEVVGGADAVLDLLDRTEQAEEPTSAPGTPAHDAELADRAELRAQLRQAAGTWVAGAVDQTVAEFLGGPAQVVAESNGRLLVRLGVDRLAVVVVASAENDALAGSRPGLQQQGTATDIGQLRNELAASPETKAWAWGRTRQLQQGLVRHVRVQGVLAAGGFVGMRVTEFEVTRPPHDQPGAPRPGLEPYRYVDPGLAVRETMRRAVAGWTPSSVTDAIDNALRWLPHVNPLHSAFPVTDRMPWSNNCGDCSRAVADLVQGRDARAAFGDNGARAIDSYRWFGTGPGELREMWRWAAVTPGFRTWHGDPVSFTADADARIGGALAAQPEGTVAIVLVNWADDHGAADRGHWFNAAVTERGVEWVDGQTAGHGAWPPPHDRPYYGYSVITRAQGSDTWVDLFGDAVDGPATPFAPGSIRDGLAGVAQPSAVGTSAPSADGHPSHGIWALDPADAAFAARIANYVGDWPEDEDREEPARHPSPGAGGLVATRRRSS